MKNYALKGIFYLKKPHFKQTFRIMRATVILLLMSILCSVAENSYSQSARVKINKKNSRIDEVIKDIEKQTDYLFFYSSRIDVGQKVSVDANNIPVSAVLSAIFENTDIGYTMEGTHIVLTNVASKAVNADVVKSISEEQQTHKLSGVVKDKAGEPIIGASVIVKGEKTGAITNLEGAFELTVPDNATISITFIGYTPQEIKVGNRTSINVVMLEDTKLLDEVVVTALGIKRSEKALGYSVQKIGGDAVTDVKGADLATSLTGKIAGLNIRNSTDFLSSPTVVLRGASPMIVIDGVQSSNIGLRELAPDDIESFQVLKGGAASALYGEAGRNGALMITTKRASKDGVIVSVNSNTMFHCGFLRLPEVHSSYS